MSILFIDDNKINLSTSDGEQLRNITPQPDYMVNQLINEAIVKINQLEQIANDEGSKAFVYKEELDKAKAQLKKYREITTKSQQKIALQVKTMKHETTLISKKGYKIKYNETLMQQLRKTLKDEYTES
jgi:hypothetical protein